MATGGLALSLTMMLTLPGKLELVCRSAAGMRNRFSELEYRSDEHPSRTVRCLRHAGTWLKERVPSVTTTTTMMVHLMGLKSITIAIAPLAKNEANLLMSRILRTHPRRKDAPRPL